MKYLILGILSSCLTSCSTTYVKVQKTVYVFGTGNKIEQGGSNLKDNKLDQAAQGEIKLPIGIK